MNVILNRADGIAGAKSGDKISKTKPERSQL